MRNARNSWKVYKADALLHTNVTCNINKIQLYCTASHCTIVSKRQFLFVYIAQVTSLKRILPGDIVIQTRKISIVLV